MANKLLPFKINGRPYYGYADYWFFYEQVLEVSPTRSNDGRMGDINNINRFYVPHLWIDFAYMDIDTYRQFEIDTEPIEMTISCLNPRTNTEVFHKMYLAPKERLKMRAMGGEYFGVYDTKLEFIGTLNDIEDVNITYMPNGATGSVSGQTVIKGQEFEIESSSGLSYSGYAFNGWNTLADGSGIIYNEGQVAVANYPMTLYANWKASSLRTLSFNYMEGQMDGESEGSEVVYNKEVTQNQAVGELPSVVTKTITYDGVEMTEPYDFIGWYSLMYGKGSLWTSTTTYTASGNITIYAYMQAQNKTITFNSNGGNYTPTSITQGYNSIVYEPYAPTKDGYTFGGWYKDSALTNPFVFTVMPPINTTLYAKWI